MASLIPCPRFDCDRTFATTVDRNVHTTLDHADDQRMTRPVSCWRCAAYLPTTRHADGTVSAAACACGWTHPHMATTAPA